MKDTKLPVLPCMCATLRRASRAITQVYEDALRPMGLKVTQFTILQVLARAGEVTQGELGGMLVMDSTTLTRTLEIMLRQRWVAKRRGKDRRQWRLSLAARGAVQLKRGTPHWEKMQAQLRGKLGSDGWENLLHLSNEAANAVTEQGEQL
ncbi:MAG: MarR family winged helix-turn-helix transcriptional regulator [Acidobacteriota bacterium]|nr:MarR family winged helix-turn-helix transcriptional regulator [Acidobacteriota bacterium]